MIAGVMLCISPVVGEPVASLHQGRLKRILQSGVFRVGVQQLHPLVYEGGERPGIDIEIIRRIEKDFGLHADVVTGTVDELLAMVAEGKLDLCLGGISSTIPRARRVSFTRPYIVVTPGGLLSRTRIPDESQSVGFSRRLIHSLHDLQLPGKMKVGVRGGGTNEAILKSDARFSTYQIVPFANYALLLQALEQGQVDMLVADDIWIRTAVKEKPALLSRFQPILGQYREEHLSFVVPPGDPEHLLFFDFVVKEYQRTGVIARILDGYFDVTRDYSK